MQNIALLHGSHLMKAKIVLVSIILSLFLTSCAAPQLKKSNAITVNSAKEETANLVYKLAYQCWSRDWGLFQDGIRVERNDGDIRGIVISARRFAPDLRSRIEPFIVAIIEKTKNGTEVEIREMKCETCSYHKYSQIIEKWLSGNHACFDEKKSHNKANQPDILFASALKMTGYLQRYSLVLF